MRSRSVFLAVVLAAVAIVAGNVASAHWVGYGGWYGYRGYWGGYYGPRVGVYLGSPWYWGTPYAAAPWYGYAYPYPYAAPAWRYAPPIDYSHAVPPTEYVERPAQAAPGGRWYYCVDPPGYYPHVSRCLSPWIGVAPFDVDGGAGKPRSSP